MAVPKVLYVGLDACDAELMQQLAAAGRCPTLASLLGDGAVVPTIAPYGTFVGSSWMTITTGRDVAHHGFWNWLEVDPQTYQLRYPTPREAQGRPFWEQLSATGRRVAVLDVPHMGLPESFNGVLLKEWGCHDRHDGTASLPAAVLIELDHTIGRHPVGCRSHPAGDIAFAPCDYTLRDGGVRTFDEERRLLDLLRQGVDAKRRASLAVLEREPWDLFATVLGECHCVGHQFWHVHDPTHPRHESATRRLLGDPVEDVYAQLDAVLGELLARAGADTTVYVQMNHGMGPHFDGDHLLDQLLARIDQGLQGTFRPGRLSRLGATMLGRVPDGTRAALQRAAAAGLRAKARLGEPVPAERPGPHADRRFFQVPGNTSVGAVRFNLVGREGQGAVRAGAEYEALREAVGQALLDVIDVATGTPLVRRVVRAEEVFERLPGDRLPDLFVEWNRASLIERVWSPLTGTIAARYGHWRTGDHHDRGLFIARGSGIAPGRRTEPMALVDTAPTVAASLGVALADVDGRVRWDLVGDAPRASSAPPPTRPTHRLAVGAPPRRRARPQAVAGESGVHLGAVALDVASNTASRMDALAVQLQETVHALHHRVTVAERERLVWTTMAWLAQEPVLDDLLISVVTPTYARPDRLVHAVRSVLAQRHQQWEMVIVDDGSDTAAKVVADVGDPRIRVVDADHGGACAARNVGLAHVTGDVVTYLDDDNLFDPAWLHAVAWAFRNRPDTEVLYGARVIDDDIRVHRTGSGGWPWMQFAPFDRSALEQHNFADMGVIAHRAGMPARFDESLVECGDWDFFLALTEHITPVELPAIAVYYRTEGLDRITGRRPGDADRVREKWARRRRGRATDGQAAPPAPAVPPPDPRA